MFATTTDVQSCAQWVALAQVALRIDVRSGHCHAPAHDYPLLQSDGAALTQRVYLCTRRAR